MDKDSIVKRMLRFAANLFGVRSVELLDPILVLFIESLAEEVHKLSGEINDIESRMQETLASLLCPDAGVNVHPSHCILHTTPEEGKVMIRKESTFILNDKRFLPDRNLQEIILQPVCNTTLRKGGVRYLVYNGFCYAIDSDQNKTLVSRSSSPLSSGKNSCWIGVETEVTDTLQNLSFYFDFETTDNKKEYLHLLSFATWKLKGKMLTTRPGIYTVEESYEDDTVAFFAELDLCNKLDHTICELYAPHFITLTGEIDMENGRERFPEKLANDFTGPFINDISTPLLWFEIEYPPMLQSELMQTLNVCINAFPVSNKFLRTKTTDISKKLGVIPLDTDNHESFISIHSLTDLQNRQYHELPFLNTPEVQYRTYSLRRGGYERYSQREAKETLSRLMESLNKRSAMTETADEILMSNLEKIINRMEEKPEVKQYVQIDLPDTDNTFFIKYWVTNGEAANHLKQSVPLEYRDTDIKVNPLSIYTLSPTTGGKKTPGFTEREQLRMNSLVKQEVLVTKEDIIRFCRRELEGTIVHAEVKNGLTSDNSSTQAFIRTTDVILTPKKEMAHIQNEKETQRFKELLEKHSPATFNYRVFINHEQ